MKRAGIRNLVSKDRFWLSGFFFKLVFFLLSFFLHFIFLSHSLLQAVRVLPFPLLLVFLWTSLLSSLSNLFSVPVISLFRLAKLERVDVFFESNQTKRQQTRGRYPSAHMLYINNKHLDLSINGIKKLESWFRILI